MKLVTYNIQYGFGADGRYDLARAAEIIREADIIALQEVERHWSRSRFDDQPALLGRMLPDHHWVYGPAFDMDADFRDGEGRLVHRRRQFGPMILSRMPIVWSRLIALPMRRMLSPLNTRNAALECMIRTPAGPIRVLSIHLAHVGTEERLMQIDHLLQLHREATLEGGPWSGRDDEPHRGWTEGEPEPESPAAAIWMGDFNSEPHSEEYRRITGSAPYHRGAAYAGGFTDAAVAAGQAADAFATHERRLDGTIQRRRLDYCFVSSVLAKRVGAVRVGTGEVASDHWPVFIDIDLEQPD